MRAKVLGNGFEGREEHSLIHLVCRSPWGLLILRLQDHWGVRERACGRGGLILEPPFPLPHKIENEHLFAVARQSFAKTGRRRIPLQNRSLLCWRGRRGFCLPRQMPKDNCCESFPSRTSLVPRGPSEPECPTPDGIGLRAGQVAVTVWGLLGAACGLLLFHRSPPWTWHQSCGRMPEPR